MNALASEKNDDAVHLSANACESGYPLQEKNKVEIEAESRQRVGQRQFLL
jgi:hypothetical protein